MFWFTILRKSDGKRLIYQIKTCEISGQDSPTSVQTTALHVRELKSDIWFTYITNLHVCQFCRFGNLKTDYLKMLPSAGYFKTLLCPYFNENDSCSRPFCHYKHENNRKPAETSVKKSKSEGM